MQSLHQSPSIDIIQSVLNTMNEALIVLDPANKIQLINQRACLLMGLSSSNGLSSSELPDFESDRNQLGYLIKQNIMDPADRPVNVATALGVYTITHSTISTTNSHGEFYRVIIIKDTTEQNRTADLICEYTQKLEKKIKELDHFAYVVSHDLKAPLRAISNLSLWIQEDLGTSLTEENKGNLVLLRNRVARLEAMINGILEYSKVGRVQQSPEPVDVHDLLVEVIDMLCPPPHVTITIDSEMPSIDAPRILLFQVFSNLIGNAIKYNDKSSGIVNIRSVENQGEHEFSVEDNGPGIESEFHDKIFVLFQTLQSRDKIESTGIGLTIVKKIIDEYGGKIWVESSPGKGSKFIFHWPK